jgi:hypothetical protein
MKKQKRHIRLSCRLSSLTIRMTKSALGKVMPVERVGLSCGFALVGALSSTVFAVVFSGAIAQPAQAKTARPVLPSVPVLIPKIVEDAACVLGKVNVSTFASIRTAPKPEAKELDRLNSETLVQMCDSRGTWTGVAYGTNINSCVPDAVPKAFNYKGPCKSGWIATRLTTEVAG